MNLLQPSDPRWLAVAERPDATVFHHPAWAGLLAESYGYRAMLALGDDGSALPIADVTFPLRRRLVALPFTDACGPLFGTDPSSLTDGLRDLAKSSRVDTLEIRAELPAHANVQQDTRFVRHEVPLDGDTKSLWRRLRRNHRRNVVDAEEAGITVERGTSAAALEGFYRMHVQTRRRLGVPVQPRHFFRRFAERILGTGLGFVLTAYRGASPAAAAVFMSWNGVLVCKYSARADAYVRADAIPLLFWSAMRWASDSGFRSFDLGRSDLGSAQLRSFKEGWGARELPLAYSWIARRPVHASSGRLDAALAVAIRNSSPWVCRAMGELLYRYAG